jgi:ATP-dependent DNA ligase
LLVFAGGVDSGFIRATLISLRRQLDGMTLDECPFSEPPSAKHRRDARWAEPKLGATIKIAKFTNDGPVRPTTFIGLAS